METVARPMRVAVVDDDPAIRLCVKDVLQLSTGFEFVRGFATAGEAITNIPQLQPDLTLMDIGLPDLSGIECTKRLKQMMPGLKILILSGKYDTKWIDSSLEAGALAYLLKPFSMGQFMVTLRVATRVAETENKQTHNARRTPTAKPAPDNLPLSPRERQVLGSLADGLLYKEIGDRLGISFSAVHKYQNKIFKKLRLSNRSEAIKLWFEHVRQAR